MEIRTYISIISLHVSRLNALTKTSTGSMDIKTRPVYVLSTRDILQI